MTPRLPMLEPPYPADVQAHFDAIMPKGAPPLALFRLLAGHERGWRKFRAASLLDRGPLSLREREIVIDRVCARSGCEYEWGVHVTAFGPHVGLTADQIAATVHGAADAPCWTARDAVLIAAVDALHDRATWTDDEFAALAGEFDGDQIIEILLLCGFYRTVSYIANGLALPLEPTAARFPAAV
jgi:alkylhydroperoxidase family enzyme